MSLSSLLRGPTPGYNSSADFGLLVLRAFAGLSLAFGHGLGKLPVSSGFIEGVGNLGFPVPIVFAWTAALSEFLGGLFLASGFYTRTATVFIGFTMATAGFIRHAEDPFGTKEKALLFLAVAFLFFFSGPGRYSLDRILK